MDRRTFIKTGAAAGATLALPAALAATTREEVVASAPKAYDPSVELGSPSTTYTQGEPVDITEINQALMRHFPHHRHVKGIPFLPEGPEIPHHQTVVDRTGWMYFLQLKPLVPEIDHHIWGGGWVAYPLSSERRLVHAFHFSLGELELQHPGATQRAIIVAEYALMGLTKMVRSWNGQE